MSRLRHTRQAREDLIALWSSIALDDPDAADRVLDAIADKSALLEKNPRLGPARPDIAAELRYFPVGNYLLLYRLVGSGVEIVRVLHGARDLAALFPPEP